MPSLQKLPKDTAVAQTYLANENQKEMRSLEMGVMGKLFGTKEHAPSTVAAVLAAGCLICIFMTLLLPLDAALKADVMKYLGGLILTCVGYLFGKSTS